MQPTSFLPPPIFLSDFEKSIGFPLPPSFLTWNLQIQEQSTSETPHHHQAHLGSELPGGSSWPPLASRALGERERLSVHLGATAPHPGGLPQRPPPTLEPSVDRQTKRPFPRPSHFLLQKGKGEGSGGRKSPARPLPQNPSLSLTEGPRSPRDPIFPERPCKGGGAKTSQRSSPSPPHPPPHSPCPSAPRHPRRGHKRGGNPRSTKTNGSLPS